MAIQCKEYKWTKPFTGGNNAVLKCGCSKVLDVKRVSKTKENEKKEDKMKS